MKLIAKAIVLAIAISLVNTTAFAQDYITDAITALENESVYVHASLEDEDRTTTAKLQAVLRSNDNIMLIMLPETAEQELDADIFTIANNLSEKLGNRYIIGLAIGDEVIGYSSTLPPGVVSDLMRRAKSVSNNNPVTTLITFVQNMHIWLEDNPQPVLPVLPTEDPKLWPLWLSILSSVFGILGFVIRRRNELAKKYKAENRERVYFEAPTIIKDLLQKIAIKREEVYDEKLQATLYDLCVDIEKYFKSTTKSKRKDAEFFKNHLTAITEVLEKYIEIQQNKRYYYDPELELQKGKESMIDFSHSVLDSIRRGNSAGLIDYTVNTKILEAQRYR